MEGGVAESPVGEDFALLLRCDTLWEFLGLLVEEIDHGAVKWL